MKRLTAKALVIFVCLGWAAAAPAAGLVSPLRPPAVTGDSTKPIPCPGMIEPVFSIEGTTYYQDEAKSVPYPGRKKADRAAAAPLQSFEAAVLEQSDHYLATGDARAARCAMRLLHHWATKKALLGEFNRQGDAHRRWGLVGLSIAFLVTRQEKELDPSEVAETGAWLGTVGNSVEAGYPDTRLQNNHLYWAAAAAIISAIAADDRALFDWGVSKARKGANDIATDGTLPLELKRGAKALGYHSFALTALIFAAEFAAPNGVDLYAENGVALSRLADVIIANMDDTAWMDDKAGTKQEEPEDEVRSLNWAEPYYARTRDKRLEPYLAAARPIRYRHLGNTTLLFGQSANN